MTTIASLPIGMPISERARSKSIDTSAFSGFARLSTSTTPFATTALPYFCRRCAARRLAQSARSLSTPRM